MPTPYLTAGLPGVGGRIKVHPADFRVEEIPAYRPCGQGQHTYITIEKEGLATFQAVQRIARALGVDPRSVGYAGLKDAQAVTVQTISVENVLPAAVETLNLPGIRVLSVGSHTNKIKVGHLRGNRFIIRVRDVPPESLAATQAIMDELAKRGVPNYFGEQRFGLRGDTHRLGRVLVQGNDEEWVNCLVGRPDPAETSPIQQARHLYEEGNLGGALKAWPLSMENERRVIQTLIDHPGDYARAVRSIPHKMRSFFVSAYQSDLFNRLLSRRLPALDRLQQGDLAWIHNKGAVFLVQEPTVEQPRADRLEISPSGPLYGFKMTMPQGAPRAMEQEILDEEGLTLESWRRCKVEGARRPLRFPLAEQTIGYEDGLMLSFVLPSGCYATVVMNEVMKSSAAVH